RRPFCRQPRRQLKSPLARTQGAPHMPSLLVIDDEASILHAFRRSFREPEVQLLTASTAREGLDLVSRSRPDAVIMDIRLPDQSGREAYKELRRLDPRVPVLFITGHGTTDQAIEAMKLGAFDFLLKPLELAQLRELVTRAFEISRLMRVPAMMAEEAGDEAPEASDGLIGRGPAIPEAYK